MKDMDSFIYEVYLQIGGDPTEYYASAQHFRLAWSHITQTAPDVLRHRIMLSYEAQASDINVDDIIQKVLEKVMIP